MILIGAHQISKSFTARPLFQDLTFAIESDERIGLIGPNGAGKSTLLRVLAGQTDLDGGRLSVQKGLRVGFLQQVPEFQKGATVHSTVLEGSRDPDDWEEMARAQEITAKLGLADLDPQTPYEKLSGGWRKRLALARELVRQPDLLLLDEPTNHLDVESIMWLEEFLAKAPFAVMTITHDRLFLQKVSNRIIEINRRHPNGLLSVKGDYATFLRLREEQLAAQEGHETKLRNTLRRETEWLRRGAKARQTKQSARIEAAGKLAETVDELNARNQNATVRFDFQSTEKNPKKLVEAKNVAKSFNGQLVVPPTNLLITPKSRIGLMGVNGCGKSTLIKILTKAIEPDQGEVFHAERLQVSYFEQNRESLDPNTTLFKTICPQGDHVEYAGHFVHARSYLARFLFTFEQMETEVRKLSGGEQSRLLLARLMLTKANLLVLDEPTNDLDMATLEVLGEVLQEFNGAVLLVTHDRYFLDQMTNQILAFGINERGQKHITPMVGLDQWQDWHDQQLEWQEQLKSRKNKEAMLAATPSSKSSRKLSYNEQRELDGMEANIQKAETRLTELTAQAQNCPPQNTQLLNDLTQQMAQTQAEIERLYERWSELT